MGWVVDDLLEAMLNWFAKTIVGGLDVLWDLLAASVFTSPDVTVLPQVRTFSSTSLGIVNTAYVLAFLAVFLLIMGRDTVQIRYGPGELIPRLVIGLIAANFATPLCATLIEVANALTGALTAQDITSPASMQQMRITVDSALADKNGSEPAGVLLILIGLVIAVMVGMLLIQWIIRLGVLIIAVGVAPIALALHGTPQTEPTAKLWWRTMLGTLGTVVAQTVALHTTLTIFLDPNANLSSLGLPGDRTVIFNLLVVVCLLWATLKIPAMMRHYVTQSSPSPAGTILRVVLVQQLTKGLRHKFSAGGAGGIARGSGGAAGASRRAGGPWPFTSPGGGRRPLPRATDLPTRPPTSPGSASASLPTRPPSGAGPGVVGVAYPTGRPIRPYTRQELAAGVDLFGKTVPRQPPTTLARSSRPPIRAAGVVSDPSPAGPRAGVPAGVTPATVFARQRPVRAPVRGPWHMRTS
ncbi:hypothetical protein Rhe02_37500 [Rhizocola hellebori]|uniref:Type IV secretion system protein n=1 Tax=Rhizocola hellebori TaxID=1392758 RepID=A0A8J3VH93_9ACTN|nr:conjugal transfer protein TrbL family protein [Rhizocola hellebori]GIH05683.1 hypothetical protein Rhe02_37500 [Rhizocola hellebori]